MSRLATLLVVGGFVAALSGSTAADVKWIFDEKRQTWVPAEELEKPPEGVLGQGRELIKQGEFGKADKLLKNYLKEQSDAPDRQAVLFLYAECAFARGRYYQAHKRYQQVISEYPQTDEFAYSLRRELDISKAWLEGKKRRLWKLFRVKAVDEALDLLSQIEQLGAGHRIAEVALRTKADYYFRSGQFELAQMCYRRLVKEYRSKHYMKLAMFNSASSALASFHGIWFDDTPLLEAGALYNEYLDKFPEEAGKEDVDTILKQIENKRAEKEFEIGRFYVRVKKPTPAAYYFRYVLKTWPETLWAERSRAELERLGFEVEPQASESVQSGT